MLPAVLAGAALAAAGAALLAQTAWPLALGAALLVAGALLLCRDSAKSAAPGDAERRYRLIADNTNDLVCLHDLDGTYRWLSPSLSAMTGWSPDEGSDPWDGHNPDTPSAVEPLLKGWFAKNQRPDFDGADNNKEKR